MIGVLAQGRMGNQMFQLAFAYAAAKRLGTSYFIYRPKSLRYFRLYPCFDILNHGRAASYLLHNVVRARSDAPALSERPRSRFCSLVSKSLVSWPDTFESSDAALRELRDHTFFAGYFQSGGYFSDCMEEVRQLFEIKTRYRDRFLKSKGALTSHKYIAVHLRRTDYAQSGGAEFGGNDMMLPVTYYRDCLAQIPRLGGYKIVFISDDIEFARREFGEHPSHVFESNDEITDFQLLLHADGLVIANSTFSWWGALLNRSHDKLVFAPKYWLGFKVGKEFPPGIRVDGWNWVTVTNPDGRR